MFEANPLRGLRLGNLTLSALQSTILATRPHPIKLHLFDSMFEDDGKAFVQALKKRQSIFGSLTIFHRDGGPLNTANWKRLFQVGTFEFLDICVLNEEIALLPFSAKTGSLVYEAGSSLTEANVSSLNIVAEKLAFDMFDESEIFPANLFLSLFQRFAALGHFVELTFSGTGLKDEVPECVAHGLIRTLLANKNLECLD